MNLADQFVSRIRGKVEAPLPANPLAIIPEGELMLLQPRLKGNIMVDATIGAIRRGNEVYYSFREFCQGLSFPIQVNPETQTATGWYLREKNTFSMDLRKNFVQSRGQQFSVTDTDWFTQDNEIYIASKTINTWMKIDSSLDLEPQIIDLVADVPFPAEDRLERRDRKLDTIEANLVPELPRAGQKYKDLTVPSVEITAANRTTRDKGKNIESRQTANIITAGDMAGITTRTQTVWNDQNGILQFRATGEEESETTDLLGFMHARKYEFGDIFANELPLTSGSGAEWGARVTNAKDNEIGGQTKRTFEGDIPPNWDVELYDGGQLIAFQTVGEDGRYRFTDIDLYAGDNDFRLVFYGPQGELREEEISIPIDIAEVGLEGDLYDISLSLKNTETYTQSPSDDEDKGTPHVVIGYNRGITDGFSVSAGLEYEQENNQPKAFGHLGSAFRLGKSLVNVNMLTDEEMAMAFETIFRRSFGEHDFRSATIFRTDDFNPTNEVGHDPIVMSYNAGLRGPLVELFGQKISYNLDSLTTRTADGDDQFTGRASINTRLKHLSFSQGISYSKSDTSEGEKTTTTSNTNLRTSIGKTRLRANMGYILHPDSTWETLTFNASRDITPDIDAELEIEARNSLDLTTTTASLNWRHDKFRITPQLSYDSNDNIAATINLKTGFFHDYLDGSVLTRSDQTTTQGVVRGHVFLDRNGNRLFDEDEDEHLKEARIISVQIARSAETNADGIAYLDNLPEYEATDVILDPASLNDPYFVVGAPGKSVFPRPGAPVALEFPVFLSGELDGTIKRPGYRNDWIPAPNLRVQLFNMEGDMVMSSIAAYDGYYVLSAIPPGDYFMVIEAAGLRDLGLMQPKPQLVHIGYDGNILSGQDMYLSPGFATPITIAKKDPLAPKDKSAKARHITVNLGQAKSYLLAHVLKVRAGLTLRRAGLSLPLEVKEMQVEKETVYTLTAQVAGKKFNHAKNACVALGQRKMNCELIVPPSALIGNVRDRTAGMRDIDIKG